MDDDEEEQEARVVVVTGWTLDDVGYGGADEDLVPDVANTMELLRDFHKRWVGRQTRLTELMPWLLEKLELSEDVSWAALQASLDTQINKLKNLQQFLKYHKISSARSRELVFEASDVLYAIRDVFKHSTRLIKNMSPDLESMRSLMAPEDQDESVDNILTHDKGSLTAFQNAFCHLREILQGCNYRRADKKFFSRIVLGNGTHTHAFEEAVEIKEFVAAHTSYDAFFKGFCWITDHGSNFSRMVEFLSERPLAEAPDLCENIALRSYGGDADGRGAGVYDCKTDTFWPYAERGRWGALEAAMNLTRRATHGAHYACKAPDALDVCVVHLQVPFPYDVEYEARVAQSLPAHLCWREADHFECESRDMRELACAPLASALDAAVAACDDLAQQPPLCGHAWKRVKKPPDGAIALHHDGLRDRLRAGFMFCQELPCEVRPEHCVRLGSDEFAVPVTEPAMRPRAVFTQQEWDSFGADATVVNHRVYVVHRAGDGGARYFRPHAGRTWRDCHTPDIDHIFACQRFTTHDCFYVYALLGRLFYEVGEMDNNEATLFFEGIGGSGKSTVLKAMMAFWPPHLRAVLSSNMQPQFGMGSLAHGAVCICSEVSEELNLPQEEWQDATGGAWLNLAVKNKEPIVIKWKSQFLWAGNRFPKRWQNGQGQVSRRLMGVGMYHAVRPRDGRVLHRISQRTGELQRKCVLAYFEFLRINGTTDPMSCPETLPPAFRDYYFKGRRETDPIEGFLSEGSFVKVLEGGIMLMDTFRDLYNRYRLKYDMGKGLRWSEDLYRTPFSERGISVRRHERFVHDGQEYANVDVVRNLVAVE